MLLTKNQEFFMAVLPLRHFSPVEFRCKCGCGAGMEKMDADLLQMLDEARDLAGIPFPLSSAYRCPKHNKALSAHSRLRCGYPLRGFSFPFRHAASPA